MHDKDQSLRKIAEQAIEDEFYRILGRHAPQMAIEKALERLQEDSCFAQGYFAVADVVLAVQGVLNDLLEAWVAIDGNL